MLQGIIGDGFLFRLWRALVDSGQISASERACISGETDCSGLSVELHRSMQHCALMSISHILQDPYYYRQQRLPADFHPVRTSHQAWPDFNLVPDHHAPSRHYAQEHDMHPEQYYSQLRDPHGQQALDYPSLLSRPPATARNAYPERERPAALSRYTQNRPGRSQDHPGRLRQHRVFAKCLSHHLCTGSRL